MAIGGLIYHTALIKLLLNQDLRRSEYHTRMLQILGTLAVFTEVENYQMRCRRYWPAWPLHPGMFQDAGSPG